MIVPVLLRETPTNLIINKGSNGISKGVLFHSIWSKNRSEITLYHFVMYNLISKLVDI